jgi:hypothetical protein
MMKKYNKEKFKKAIERVMLAFLILFIIALAENIMCWILIFIANLFK